MGFFKSQFWQASWIWQQVSVVCVCAANFTPSLAFVYYMSSDLFVFVVCGFSPNPSISPISFLSSIE
jgi:hypothetical protein